MSGSDLRIGLNLANTELVTGHDPDGCPLGPAPDLGRQLATALGRQAAWVEYARPSDVVDAADRDEWDICFLAADPARARVMRFTAPWTRLEVCFAAAPEAGLDGFDAATARIATLDGGGYTLWLERNLSSATLVRCVTFDECVEAALDGTADVVIGIRAFFDGLDLVVFDDIVTTVDQAIGVNLAADAELTAQVLAFVDAMA